ncbi:MAG: MBOAT family O-acyltransferase [bacterium]
MLFNSYTFLLVFLPTVLAAFWLAHRLGLSIMRGPILLAASVVFYAWWSIDYLALLGTSILVNYHLGKAIRGDSSQGIKYLWLGISINLGILLYYKYTNFLLVQVNYFLEPPIANEPILLPLAISFFTFQQIAYLVDCYRGKAAKTGLFTYALFVAFFPQLIAGPIVRSIEMVPQFQVIRSARSSITSNLGPGITIFLIGLAKKVILADSLAAFATPIFSAADQGAVITMLESWIAALAYTFQLYFDFSGYSDMAIGLARMFGIKIPVNFFSPYKATSIIDFWRRWHMTLSRFLREYLYIPLGGNKGGYFGQSRNIMITMLLGGLWHGAGWTFALWGGLHGIYILINHGWEKVPIRFFHKISESSKIYKTFSWAITFIAVVSAWVIFRAQTIDGALSMISSMYGLNGLTVPKDYQFLLAQLAGPLTAMGVEFQGVQIIWQLSKIEFSILLSISFFIAFACPNTAQLFELLSEEKYRTPLSRKKLVFKWAPNAAWLLVSFLLFVFSLDNMTDVSEFLYYQF